MDIDQHIRRDDLKRYALQCGLAGIAVLLLLLVVLAGVVLLSVIKRLVLPVLLDVI